MRARCMCWVLLGIASIVLVTEHGRAEETDTSPQVPSSPRPDPDLPAETPQASSASGLAAEQPSGLGPLSGRMFAYLRVPWHGVVNSPVQQASTSLWIEARPTLGEHVYAKVTASADVIASSRLLGERLQARFREAYLGYVNSGWAFRVGEQIIPWGNADGINPTDFLTSRDYTLFATDTEVTRRGALSLFASWAPSGGDSPFEFTAVCVPAFRSSRILIPPEIVPVGVIDDGLEHPEAALRNAEVAGRAAYRGRGWDVSLVGFTGWNHTPEYAFRSLDTTGIHVGRVHRRQSAIGGDGSATLGTWVFRIETAYVWTENPSGTNPERQPSHWDSVVGVERPFFDRLRIQAQFIMRYHPFFRGTDQIDLGDAIQTGVAKGIADVNALLLNYQNRSRPMASGRIAYATEDEKFETEIVGVLNFQDSRGSRIDAVIRPVVAYRPTDSMKLSVGLEYYAGPGRAIFGALHSFSGAFAEASLFF